MRNFTSILLISIIFLNFGCTTDDETENISKTVNNQIIVSSNSSDYASMIVPTKCLEETKLELVRISDQQQYENLVIELEYITIFSRQYPNLGYYLKLQTSSNSLNELTRILTDISNKCSINKYIEIPRGKRDSEKELFNAINELESENLHIESVVLTNDTFKIYFLLED